MGTHWQPDSVLVYLPANPSRVATAAGRYLDLESNPTLRNEGCKKHSEKCKAICTTNNHAKVTVPCEPWTSESSVRT